MVLCRASTGSVGAVSWWGVGVGLVWEGYTPFVRKLRVGRDRFFHVDFSVFNQADFSVFNQAHFPVSAKTVSPDFFVTLKNCPYAKRPTMKLTAGCSVCHSCSIATASDDRHEQQSASTPYLCQHG